MDDDLFFEDRYSSDFTTSRRYYKALILKSIRESTANHSVTDDILDSLILIEKFDHERNIPTSDVMRDAFRAVAVHCTLKWLPLSRSRYFNAVQRIWALRIKNLEDSGSSDLFSPDLARWKTEIEASLRDRETSRRLLDICTLGEALNCVEVYLNETFCSIKLAFCQLAVSPTEEKVDKAVSTTQLLSIPHRGANDGTGENVVSRSAQLLLSTHRGTNEGNVDNVVSTSTQILPNPHHGIKMGNVDNSVFASSQFLSSPHRDTKIGNVDNVASASSQLPSNPHPCNNEENMDKDIFTTQLLSSPHCGTNDGNEEIVVSRSAQRLLSTHRGTNDGNVDNVVSTSTQLLSNPHRGTKMGNVDKVASASAQLLSSPHPCNNEENMDNDASAQLPSSPHPCYNEENVDKVASASAQLPSSPHPCYNEENAAEWSSLPIPEIEKVRDSLKSSVADLLAAVTDPLPKVLEVADRISSYVKAAEELQAQGVEGDGNMEVGVLEEAISKDHDRMDRSVPSPSVDHMAEPSQAKEGNEAFIRPNKMRRISLMEKNDTAHTFEWEDPIDGSADGTNGCSNKCDDPIDGSAEGTSGCSKKCDDPIDGPAEGTSGCSKKCDDPIVGPADKTTSSSDRCTLPSPKTKHVSPLKKSMPLKWVRRRKINRWTNEEENTLIQAVKKYGTQWKLILEKYDEVLGNRTQVDLKDKWRNLTR